MDIYRLRKNAQRCTKAEMQQICASAVQESFPLAEVDSAIKKLEQDLRNVAQWCCANNSVINPSRTKLLFIGTRQLMSRLP